MEWDPTGHLLATCCQDESDLKLWCCGVNNKWIDRHHVSHQNAVTYLHWCIIPGTRESMKLMIAR